MAKSSPKRRAGARTGGRAPAGSPPPSPPRAKARRRPHRGQGTRDAAEADGTGTGDKAGNGTDGGADRAARAATPAQRRKAAPERRGILTGDTAPAETLIRLARGPAGEIVPDVAAKLPGRGCWLEPDRAALETALAKRRFQGLAARGFKAPVSAEQVPGDLADWIDRLLARRCLDRLGLERGAGHVVTGFEKVAEALRRGQTAVLIHAADAAADGRAKLDRLAGAGVTVVDLFDRQELSLALGRGNVVHAAVNPSGGARTLLLDVKRLARYRGIETGHAGIVPDEKG
ncbi:hypothetical protein CCR80_10530 [Rhodothalassium salexigens]|uniref:RNA-binding protein n=1 Tax=Rhodothalassium salexigens TaxID=1086 RepID=UPI001913FC01|nr:RNA-binding protein [Rhodothalassium salexigens]MBK5921464.1 hypothetical protein [Rhodothalassium salexigens]